MQGKTIKTLHLHRGNLGKVYDLGLKCLGKVYHFFILDVATAS